MNQAELLAKISKGTATPEEIQDLGNLLNSQNELAAQATKVIEENKALKTAQVQLTKTAGESVAQAKVAADALLKVNTNVRVAQLQTWLTARPDKDTLTNKIGTMSDEDFDLFKDGKTDVEINANKAAIAAAVKPVTPAAPVTPKVPLIPNGEIVKVGEEPKDVNAKSSGFPKIAEIKEMYSLGDNPLYDKAPGMEDRAEAYLNKRGRYVE